MRALAMIALPFALLLSACNGADDDPACAVLFGGSYCLQQTGALPPFNLQQKAEASFGGNRETLIAEIESDAAGLRLVGLTPIGQTIAEVHYDNRVATARVLPDSRLSPTLLVALLQVALWPADAVRAGLRDPLTLEDDGTSRRIVSRGETVVSIDYLAGRHRHDRMHLSIMPMALSIDIETLPETGEEP